MNCFQSTLVRSSATLLPSRVSPFILAAAVLLAACDDPQPPRSCGSMVQQTVHVGETSDVRTCFEDPDGDELSYGATSSNTEIVTASGSDSTVRITGVSQGDAIVTVTATDPGQLTAEQSFTVLVPNRPPEVTEPIPDIAVAPGSSLTYSPSDYFRDPDHDVLTYTASTRDTTIVELSMSTNVLTLSGMAEGTASVTVTASDPGELTAAQQFVVTVEEPRLLFRDDFSTDSSLGDWFLRQVKAEVDEGVLELTNTVTNRLGWALRPARSVEWGASASMGRSHEDGWPTLLIQTNSGQGVSSYAFNIGSTDFFLGIESNYRLLFFQDGSWKSNADLMGTSEVINDELDELTEIVVSMRNRTFVAKSGTTELLSLELPSGWPDEALILYLTVWPGADAVDRTTLFDWVEMRGTPVGNARSDGRLAASDVADMIAAMDGIEGVTRNRVVRGSILKK